MKKFLPTAFFYGQFFHERQRGEGAEARKGCAAFKKIKDLP
jgi:hypothetical protein